MKMWWMLNTPPRSTHHLALEFAYADIVHCPPPADRSVYRPSTALSAPQGCPGYGASCHAGLSNAKFSVIWIYRRKLTSINMWISNTIENIHSVIYSLVHSLSLFIQKYLIRFTVKTAYGNITFFLSFYNKTYASDFNFTEF